MSIHSKLGKLTALIAFAVIGAHIVISDAYAAKVWADWVNEHVFVGNTGAAKASAAKSPRTLKPTQGTVKLNQTRHKR
jgi:hypothetical protein